MNKPFTIKNVRNYILAKYFKESVIYNYKKYCDNRRGQALLYYKTDCFTPGYSHTYEHTNIWEVGCMAKVLNNMGYWVDIIDRTVAEDFLPNNKYDIFISDGAVDSTRYYSKYAKILKNAVKIYFAVNPSPDVRNNSIASRYSDFEKRNHHQLKRTRFITEIDIDEQMGLTDIIFSVGNEVTNATFYRFKKEFYKIFLSTSPEIYFKLEDYKNKRKNNFLFFAGDGNIFKGLDLLIESFAQMPENNLYVCTTLESDFKHFYQPLLNRAKNIKIENFIMVGSKKFNELTSKCGFVTLLGCAEGTATSVLTCMRKGLIPVVTAETGVDLADFGFEIKELSVKILVNRFNEIVKIDDADFKKRINKSWQESWQYTQQAFERSFTTAIINVLMKRGMI